MNDPALRVLEHALEETYSGPQRIDVTWRVLQELKSPGRARAEKRPLRTAGILVAAAVLVAAFGGAWKMRAADSSLAVASLEVLVLDTGGTAASVRDIEPGSVILVQQATRLELPNRVAIDAEADTVLRWSTDPESLALVSGSIVVDANGNDVVVHNETGRLELSRDGRARFDARSSQSTLPSAFDIARRLAMQPHSTALASVVTATLFTGSGVLFCLGGTHALEPALPVTVDPHYGQEAVASDINPFEHELGTWELEVSIPEVGDAVGFEQVRVGPHPLSIVSDFTITVRGRSRDAHVVLMWDERRSKFSGSFTDSGGGQIGILKGQLREDGAQVVEMFRTDGQPFDLRRVSWHVDADERRTQYQALEDGEWRTVQDLRHYRARPEVYVEPQRSQSILAVQDMQAQVAFYRDVLGFEVVAPRDATRAAIGRATLVLLETRSARLALHAQSEGSGVSTPARLALRVDSLEQARERLKACEVEVGPDRQPQDGVAVIDLNDPEGNIVQLEQHAPNEAANDGR